MKLRLDRAFAVPATRVLSSDNGITRVKIEGLVCDAVCARRSRAALARIDAVERVSVDFERGIATIEGAPAPPEAYQREIEAVVAGMPLRRALAKVRTAFRRGALRWASA